MLYFIQNGEDDDYGLSFTRISGGTLILPSIVLPLTVLSSVIVWMANEPLQYMSIAAIASIVIAMARFIPLKCVKADRMWLASRIVDDDNPAPSNEAPAEVDVADSSIGAQASLEAVLAVRSTYFHTVHRNTVGTIAHSNIVFSDCIELVALLPYHLVIRALGSQPSYTSH